MSALLEDRPEGWYFTGDLDKGKAAAHAERHVWLVTPDRHAYGSYQVNLCDDSDDPEGSVAEFGAGRDEETAWRFALGAFFGPADDQYLGDDALSHYLNHVERVQSTERSLLRMRVLDVLSRLGWLGRCAVCAVRGHRYVRQFCSRCGWFLP